MFKGYRNTLSKKLGVHHNDVPQRLSVKSLVYNLSNFSLIYLHRCIVT